MHARRGVVGYCAGSEMPMLLIPAKLRDEYTPSAPKGWSVNAGSMAAGDGEANRSRRLSVTWICCRSDHSLAARSSPALPPAREDPGAPAVVGAPLIGGGAAALGNARPATGGRALASASTASAAACQAQSVASPVRRLPRPAPFGMVADEQ